MVGIDNPFNSETEIYSDEYRNLIFKDNFRNKIEERHSH